VFVLIDQKRFSLLRLCAVPTLAAALFVVSRTGSRTGLLGIAVMIGAAFVLMPMRDRIKLSLVAAAVGILFVTAASDRLIERYKTMFTDSAKDESAKMSTESRMWVMKESFRQMLRHPVFGVGPGNFTVASADTKRSIGLSFRLYENAHNTYGQVASETGVPGFVMFCSIVLWSLHQNLKLYRRVRSHPAYARIKRLAFSLFVSLTGFSVMAFFGNYPYLFYLPLLSGLTVSLARAANAEIRLRESAVPAAARRPATPVWGR
jgi:O-antigen ligase